MKRKRKFSHRGSIAALKTTSDAAGRSAVRTQANFYPLWSGSEPFDTLSLSDAEALTRTVRTLQPDAPGHWVQCPACGVIDRPDGFDALELPDGLDAAHGWVWCLACHTPVIQRIVQVSPGNESDPHAVRDDIGPRAAWVHRAERRNPPSVAGGAAPEVQQGTPVAPPDSIGR